MRGMPTDVVAQTPIQATAIPDPETTSDLDSQTSLGADVNDSEFEEVDAPGLFSAEAYL